VREYDNMLHDLTPIAGTIKYRNSPVFALHQLALFAPDQGFGRRLGYFAE
jgi:hypothetical protein